MWLKWTLSWLTHGWSGGEDEVWADVIIVLGPGCCGGRMMSGWDVIMALARGCRGQRMRSGCTKSWLWPMDALRDG